MRKAGRKAGRKSGRKSGRLGIFVILACALAPQASANERATKSTADKSVLSAIDAFQARDAQLQNIGWKLLRANAPFCTNAHLSIGLQLQDMASYGDPDRARKALGLSGDFAVQTIAAGSPADAATISPNLEITRVDQARLNDWPAKARFDWQRLKRAHDAIDAALANNGTVELTYADKTRLNIAGVPACATRFELLGKSKKALADGARVQFGARFPGFDYPEDEFAAVIAHELAHNLLEHRKWLDAMGRKRRNVRATEREADRLMPWLIANAGYDPRAAVRFMERWGPHHSKGVFRARTHDGWDERAQFIAAEAALVEAQIATTGIANWAVHFRREIEPLAQID